MDKLIDVKMCWCDNVTSDKIEKIKYYLLMEMEE